MDDPYSGSPDGLAATESAFDYGNLCQQSLIWPRTEPRVTTLGFVLSSPNLTVGFACEVFP